jgi:diacylglycerol O-acyltransferase / wax synthase
MARRRAWPSVRSMTDRLTALDATFLELEEADPSAHMHVGGVLVFDPLPGGGAPSLAGLCEHLADRLQALPRFHHRLSDPRTGGLHWPAWEPDPGFDVRGHVRRAALPAPGGRDELLDWAGEFWSHRLGRDRPLWEMVLLEGLGDGRWALATKTHHCMVDGIASVDVGHVLLDASPEGAQGEGVAAALPAGMEDEGARHLRLPGVPRAVEAGARAGLKTLRHPRRLVDALERSRAMVDLIVRDEVIPAPRSCINVPLSPRRHYRAVPVALADLKRIKDGLGGTVNDVVLAAVTGGVRRLLEHRGESPPPGGLRAMVPVNVRAAAERAALGNRITSLFVHLPVAEEDALRRYLRVAEEAEALKAGPQALGAQTLVDLSSLAPPVLHSLLARSMYATRLFNLTVTNVPGPPATLYAFGAPLRQILPLVPLAAEHALGVAVISYDGGVVFGLNADPDALPDLSVVAEGIVAALAELEALVEPHTPAAAPPG